MKMAETKKIKLLLLFPKNLTAEPVTYTLVKKYDLKTNILKASINYNIEGSLLMEVEGEPAKVDEAIAYLRNININVTENGTSTLIEKEKCIGCGVCVAACETGALYLEPYGKVCFNAPKCMECMLCVKACTQRIIHNAFDRP